MHINSTGCCQQRQMDVTVNVNSSAKQQLHRKGGTRQIKMAPASQVEAGNNMGCMTCEKGQLPVLLPERKIKYCYLKRFGQKRRRNSMEKM